MKKVIKWILIIFFGLFILNVVVEMSLKGDSPSEHKKNEDNIVSKGEDTELPKGIQYEGQTTDPAVRGMITLVKEKLTRDTINAESVQFQNVFYANQNNMTAICGEINIIKSSSESGYKRFISNGIADTAMEGYSKNFNALWNQVCKH